MQSNLLFLILLLVAMPFATLAQTNYNLSNLTLFDGEPYIAVNPSNQKNIVAGWMRLRADGKIWIATKSSFDNGQTWSAISFMPHDTVVNGSADVSIAFHTSGVAYISWINFRTVPDTAGAVYLARSDDGGLTWGTPSKVFDETDKVDLPFDRPWVTVDNSGGINDGVVFVTSMSAYWYVGQHHIYLRTSDDGGATWSTVKQVDDTSFSVGSLTASYGGISVGKDGRAYITFLSYDVSVSPFVRYYCATTTNQGASFRRDVVGIAFVSGGSDFTKAWCVAANPVVKGHAVLTWVDKRHGDFDVLLSATNDGGLTWSVPARVNDDEVNNGIEQDMVWANFSSSGTLAIAWRDRRLSGTGSTVPFDIYVTRSSDTAGSFSRNYKVTTVSSPYFSVPQGNSFIGCAQSDSSIYMNWGDYRNSPDWDIYFNKTDHVALATSVNDVSPAVPSSVELFPNPAYTSIRVSFSVPPSKVGPRIVIFNALGQVVTDIRVPDNQRQTYSEQFDVSNLSDGAYYLFVESNGVFVSNTMFMKRGE